jgi:hypothetical protein
VRAKLAELLPTHSEAWLAETAGHWTVARSEPFVHSDALAHFVHTRLFAQCMDYLLTSRCDELLDALSAELERAGCQLEAQSLRLRRMDMAAGVLCIESALHLA